MTRPNVLMIVTDHWFGSLLGIAGHPCVQTPTLDDVARNGVRFSNACSANPVCIPARRTLMTGTTSRTHGDRIFNSELHMPENLPTLAQTFRDNGYQAYAVGKIHVHPQRDRIGFDDVLVDDEGRGMFGVIDDYEVYLGDQGYPGEGFMHGMSNNDYNYRAWHLPEHCHATNWATRMMCRTIKRRDPKRPSLWYVGYRHPHPPLVPLQAYLDFYRDIPIDKPYVADWSKEHDELPYTAQARQTRTFKMNERQIEDARRAFYALCTHIDHQISVIIGTLREEGILDDTMILFTSDHGDMLGNQNMWAKRVFYENSTHVPMILSGVKGDRRVGHHRVDDRLVELRDVMPTLLDLCGIPIPGTVEGLSMVGEKKHPWIYGEDGEDAHSSRMVHDGRHKLIYYPIGNRLQLFDLVEDPCEMTDRIADPAYADVRENLTEILIGQMYGSDLRWIEDGKLVGELPNRPFRPGPNRSRYALRGYTWPAPALTDKAVMEWYPEADD